MRFFTFFAFFVFVSCQQLDNQFITEEKYTDFVNPFIGTDGPGNTFPGATLPFGMVQLSPDIGIAGWDRIAGYFYQDSIISGFSHTHLSGTGAGDLYDILVMPTNSRFSEKMAENNYKPFSKFSHEKETATAGYYAVELLSYGIKAELTASQRVGFQRFTFPKDENTKITVDLGFAMNWDAPTDTFINVIDEKTIEGYRKSTGWAADQRIFFRMEFSKPFANYTIFSDEKQVKNPAQGKNTRIELHYQMLDNEQVTIKTAIATSNLEGARLAMQTEANSFDFDFFKKKAQQTWEQALQKVKISTNDRNKKTIFYTMLYQSMLCPMLLSDPNGNYKGADGNLATANGFKRYDTFSLWDTFRAAHPLLTLLHPERVSDLISSLLAHYNQTGRLPVWSMQGNETNMMIGYHAVPVVVDAYFKGFIKDTQTAYEACKASAMVDERQIDLYKKYGFVPYDLDTSGENWSVSKTLEYAYDDWCIAMFANDLGKDADYQYFMKRSENWRNLYDEKSTFFRPKNSEGKFITPFIPKDYTPYFCESNAWHYAFFVPQNIPSLVEKMGGKERFEQKLDSLFSYKPLPTDKLPIFSTGMIGQYAHGNEPSHHAGYLYNYTEKPSKTQAIIRKILGSQYKNEPNGHCGNEDCGQMSAWFVMSSMGFYSVNPAQGVYLFGSPFFEKAEIQIDNQKSFVIEAKNFSEENKFIKAIFLNGKKYNKLYIKHLDIIKGGTLTFEMTNLPNDNELKNYELPELTIFNKYEIK